MLQVMAFYIDEIYSIFGYVIVFLLAYKKFLQNGVVLLELLVLFLKFGVLEQTALQTERKYAAYERIQAVYHIPLIVPRHEGGEHIHKGDYKARHGKLKSAPLYAALFEIADGEKEIKEQIGDEIQRKIYDERHGLRDFAYPLVYHEQNIPQPVLDGKRRNHVEEHVERGEPEQKPPCKEHRGRNYKIVHAERPYRHCGHKDKARARRDNGQQAQPEKVPLLLPSYEKEHWYEHLHVKIELP